MIKILISSLFLIVFLVYFLLYTEIISQKSNISIKYKTQKKNEGNLIKGPKENFEETLKYINTGRNHEYLINNNLAQYSSYITIHENSFGVIFYEIEVLVFFRKRMLITETKLDDFLCVVKILDSNYQLIEIDALDSPKFYMNSNKKLIFKLKPHDMSLNKIVVAAILKKDYSKNMTEKMFEEYLKLQDVFEELNVVMPYSFIKYQRPTIINSIEPRLPTVGFCVHFTYAIPEHISRWMKQHLSFGVKEIMIYDAIKGDNLTKFLNRRFKNENRITIIPYRIEIHDLCNPEILFNQLNSISNRSRSFLSFSCFKFFSTAFERKILHRFHHEQITSNDCFSILSKKYEFIGYYDLDEYIYPITLKYSDLFINKTLLSCDANTRKHVCSMNPLTNYFNANMSNVNHLYNYLISIVSMHKGLNMAQLRSIYFHRSNLTIY